MGRVGEPPSVPSQAASYVLSPSGSSDRSRGWGKGSCQCGAMGEEEEVRRGCPRRSAGPARPRRASAVL